MRLDEPVKQWKITVLGEEALLEFEEQRDKDAKAERQQRFENKISIASVLVPAVTFILGLLVEHFSGIISIALSVFG